MAKKTKKADHPHVAKLKSLGVYDKFEKNLAAWCTVPEYVEMVGVDATWHSFIEAAFVWGITAEGFKFWDKIANK